MASILSQAPLLTLLSHRRVRNVHYTSCSAGAPKPASQTIFSNRRQLVFLLTASTALTAREAPSIAEDIPLFGLRKKLQKTEEAAVEIVKEGFEAAEKGLETAEKGVITIERGIEAAEKGIETAEKGVEEAVSFPALAQACVVAGAEVVAVFVATSAVNGILEPSRKT
ncbi:hypothetical protein HS088_TW13G01080 [Tripterygium wilfordii]|uniref:Synechocystis YCF37 n=1 Tax=Tripterygium wilfordii TaxID=458696 RepID=A0A7J7CVM2_TRIWF|nr:uncharacterized protein LOC120013068 [Tripterygium wilfordii]KAF5738185.1 hypothetical protein HS088_TW13G01080 [Tripterygium wilfordii]